MSVALAVLVSVAILVWPRVHSSSRLLAVRAHDVASDSAHDSPHALGIAQLITALISRVRAGASLVAACAQESSTVLATPRLTLPRLTALVTAHRSEADHGHHERDVALGLLSAARLSDELGCPVSPCLQAVLDAYSRVLAAEELRSQAFAVPKATMGLLSGLPFITVALGYVMGAHPLRFLFGSSNGLFCLGLGLLCYAVGLIWVGALMREMSRR